MAINAINPSITAEFSVFDKIIVPYTKTALIGISVLGMASAAYVYPLSARLFLVGISIKGVSIITKSLNFDSPETIKKVMVVVFSTWSITLWGCALGGVLPVCLRKLSVAIATANLGDGLFATSISCFILGMTPYFKMLIEKALSFDDIPMLRQWTRQRNSAFRDVFRIRVALCLMFPPKPFSIWDFPALAKMRIELEKNAIGTERYVNNLLEHIDVIMNFTGGNFPVDIFNQSWNELINTLKEPFFIKNEGKEAGLENHFEKIMNTCTTHLLSWNEKKPEYTNLLRSFYHEHFLTQFLVSTYRTIEQQGPLTKKYEAFCSKIRKLDPSKEHSIELIINLNKELYTLEQEITSELTLADNHKLVIDSFFNSETYYFTEDELNSIESLPSKYRSMIKNLMYATGQTTKQHLEKITSKAQANKTSGSENLLLTDDFLDRDLPEFLTADGFYTMGGLEKLIGKKITESVDYFKNVLKIGSVKNLITQGLFTEEELPEVINQDHRKRKPIITKRIEKYIRDKTPSIRKISTTTRPIIDTSLLRKINEKASLIFYYLALTFTLLAPVINQPEQAVIGLISGIAFGIVKSIASTCPYCQNKLRQLTPPEWVFLTLSYNLFTRNRYYAQIREDRAFIESSIFGKLLRISAETMVAWLTTIADIPKILGPIFYLGYRSIQTIIPLKNYPIAGFFQGFILGNRLATNLQRISSTFLQNYRTA